MKVRIDHDGFAKAVSRGTKSLPTRPTVPVLAGALLQATGSEFTISSFDYEVSTQVTIGATVDEPGSTLVSGRLLTEIVKSLPDRPVAVVDAGSRAELTCGGTRFMLPTMPVEDYPQAPVMPDALGTVDASTFSRAVERVAIAASRDETLPVLTGIQLDRSADVMTIMATDRYRLAVCETNWQPRDQSSIVRLLVPAKTLVSVAKLLGSLGGEVTIGASAGSGGGSMIGFSCEGFSTVSRVLDGGLPDVNSLIGFDTSLTLRVGTEELAKAVRRVSLVAERNDPVRLAVSEGTLIVESGGDETAEASAPVACRCSGGSLQTAFNPTYLLDCLSAISAPTTLFSMPEDRHRALVVGESETGVVDDYRHLLLPLRWT